MKQIFLGMLFIKAIILLGAYPPHKAGAQATINIMDTLSNERKIEFVVDSFYRKHVDISNKTEVVMKETLELLPNDLP